MESKRHIDRLIPTGQDLIFINEKKKEVLEKDRNTVVLFSTGGVTQSEIRKKIITLFNKYNAIIGSANVDSADNEKELLMGTAYRT